MTYTRTTTATRKMRCRERAVAKSNVGRGHRSRTRKPDRLTALRAAVREFLHTIAYVPMRAVDCDQAKADRLFIKLAKLSGARGIVIDEDCE